jgi:hypothetical protein
MDLRFGDDPQRFLATLGMTPELFSRHVFFTPCGGMDFFFA